jgi:hypothetical protein
MSPNWPDKYPSRKECTWNISSTAGHRVKIVSPLISLLRAQALALSGYGFKSLLHDQHGACAGLSFPAGKWGDAVNLEVGALSRRREHAQSSVPALLTAALWEVAAAMQGYSAVCVIQLHPGLFSYGTFYS